MWVLIDNLEPNKPCAINMDKIENVSWDKGTLSFDFNEGSISVEAEKTEFIKIVSMLDVKYEVE